jgi:hypothetical protein
VDKAKADDQRHAGERQHHHLQVRKAVGGNQRKIVHNTLPKDIPVISRSEPAEGSAVGTYRANEISPIALMDQRATGLASPNANPPGGHGDI